MRLLHEKICARLGHNFRSRVLAIKCQLWPIQLPLSTKSTAPSKSLWAIHMSKSSGNSSNQSAPSNVVSMATWAESTSSGSSNAKTH